MNKYGAVLLTFFTLGLGMVTSSANAALIATWSDPGTSSFSFVDNDDNNDGIGHLTASSTGINSLFLAQLGVTFTNASYTLKDTGGGALSTTSQVNSGGIIQAAFEGGILEIKTDSAEHTYAAGTVLLTATFDSATGFFGTVLSSDITANNVTFSGPALNGLVVTNEIFTFSPANIVPGSALIGDPDMEDWVATTAFTSSATLIPVPAAVWLFGSDLLGLVGIARRKTV